MAKILNITPEQYHKDPCATPSLSASAAKTLILKSPAHAWLEHPRLGGKSRESTTAMDEGTIIHELVLGKGSGLVVVEADDFRTKAAQAQRDAAFEVGKTPVIARKMDDYRYAADRIRKNLTELIGRSIPMSREVCIEWEYTIPQLDDSKLPKVVLCRSMLDAVDLESGFILDLKTTTSAQQMNVERDMCRLGYDIQAVAYPMAIEQINPAVAGRVQMVFAFAELDSDKSNRDQTFSVTPGRPSGPMNAFGASRWGRAAETWYHCLSSGKWPHYTKGVVTLYPPTYEIAREEEIRQCGL